MKNFLLFTLFLLFVFSAKAMELDQNIPVVIDADQVEYLQDQAKVVASGKVKMSYQDVEVYCDSASYDTKKNNANLSGNIKIVRGTTTAYSNDITYDFNEKSVKMADLNAEYKPFFVRAKEVERIGDEKFIFKDAAFTTCNLEKPHYRMVTKRVVIYPKRKIVAKNVIVKVGNVPVFYFPYFAVPFYDGEFPFILSFGKSDEWGTYMLSRWRYNINEQNRGRIYLDWYEDRGRAAGVVHKTETKNYGEALFTYYQLQDKLYDLRDRNDLFEEYPDRSAIDAKYLEDDRYRAQVAYDWRPTEDDHIIAEYNRYSDKYMSKDFFYHEYEIDQHPLSYILAEHRFDYSSLSFLAQLRANKFWSEAQYQPRVKYDYLRQNLGWDKLYFESQSEVAALSYKYANSSLEQDVTRLSSHNRISYAQKAGWLNITPYAGEHTTFYSQNRFGEEDIFRVAAETGTALSTKLYNPFDADFKIFGRQVDKMRHIMTPTIDYNYTHSPTVSQDNIYQFDGVDLLARAHKVTLSLDNKLQAKNNSETWDLFYFAPSVDYLIDEEGEGSHFDLFKMDLEFYPRSGISLTANSEYDCQYGYFTQVDAALTVSGGVKKPFVVSLGHSYLRRDSSQGTLGTSYQLTPKLQLSGNWTYKYREREFNDQQYTLRTDLHCWWFDTGVKIDDDKDWTVWFAFTLKDFPALHFGVDRTYKGAKNEY